MEFGPQASGAVALGLVRESNASCEFLGIMPDPFATSASAAKNLISFIINDLLMPLNALIFN
jgi:hypothetical protein